jgi:hypothetical protein
MGADWRRKIMIRAARIPTIPKIILFIPRSSFLGDSRPLSFPTPLLHTYAGYRQEDMILGRPDF